MISFVPLNSAGGPTHEYDMLTVSPGVLSCNQEEVEVPWVRRLMVGQDLMGEGELIKPGAVPVIYRRMGEVGAL